MASHSNHHMALALSVWWCIAFVAHGWVLIPPFGTSLVASRNLGRFRRHLASSTSSGETTSEALPSTVIKAVPNDGGNNNSNNVWSDEEFQSWFHQQLVDEAGPILHETYGDAMFGDLARSVTEWRQRFRMGISSDMASDGGKSSDQVAGFGIWKRLFKRDRVVKEVVESIPIIHAIDHYVQSLPSSQENDRITILDLCSGKGYLSMILSEYLPAHKVEKFVLIDKAWPMCHAEPKAHHMNWDHIYGNYTTTTTTTTTSNGSEPSMQSSYFTTWPIPLHTSKQNLKKSSDLRRLQQRLGNIGGPCFVLGIHLCGTLSIQAVQMFYSVPTIQGLILKPCCLPGMAHEKQQTHFQAGRYAFPTKEVCAPGFWKKKEWEGPPRWHLQGKFEAWCRHLYEGMKHVSTDVGVVTKLLEAPVQTSGGFQNTFLFAQKEPISDGMWDGIETTELKLKELQQEEQ